MKKQKELTGDTSVFRQERRTFFLVLWLFDISYLLRAIYSQVFFFDQIENFTVVVLDLFVGILFDLIPLSMILYIHRRNFKTIQNERVAARNAQLDQAALSERSDSSCAVSVEFLRTS
mmetsp:Transcript_35971/g.47332  ORF Transcript_35971/g.47332 Transcript_35971/m.47332 type:complete len:118 (-) Transcript_35971:523-876(-)